MAIEIRPCQDAEELRDYLGVVKYVFAVNEPPGDFDEFLKQMRPEWTMNAYVDGKIATSLGAYPFRVWLNGARVKMAGVTNVGTMPNRRRQGLLRQVMGRSLESYREHGQYYAILWASMGAIYQRFGFGAASNMMTYSFDPRLATLEAPRPPAGSIDMPQKDDATPIVKEIYDRWAEPRTLAIDRAPGMWDRMFRNHEKKPFHFAIYRNDDGEARGYVIYHTEEIERAKPSSEPEQAMQIIDFMALDNDAWVQLWEFIRGHDLVGRVTMVNSVGDDDPGRVLLLEPRQLNVQVSDSIWLRVVDVAGALPLRPYGESGSLTLRIPTDDLCPWNEGTFRLDVDGTVGRVTRQDGGDADLTMPPRTLASLVSGHSSATHLERCGLLEARDAASLTLADRMFATRYRPHCPNGF